MSRNKQCLKGYRRRRVSTREIVEKEMFEDSQERLVELELANGLALARMNRLRTVVKLTVAKARAFARERGLATQYQIDHCWPSWDEAYGQCQYGGGVVAQIARGRFQCGYWEWDRNREGSGWPNGLPDYVIAELDFAHCRLWAAWSEFHAAAAEVAEKSLWFKFSHPLGWAEGRRLLSSIKVCVPCDAGHNLCWCDPLWI